MLKQFEFRFPGRKNAGLRHKIREAVRATKCGAANAAAVLSLAGALSPSEVETLRAVAEDYRDLYGGYKRTCDCADCYERNLQMLVRG
jgi:hypothetical protein